MSNMNGGSVVASCRSARAARPDVLEQAVDAERDERRGGEAEADDAEDVPGSGDTAPAARGDAHRGAPAVARRARASAARPSTTTERDREARVERARSAAEAREVDRDAAASRRTASPATSEPHAARCRRLEPRYCLTYGRPIDAGRDRAADDTGDRDEREHVRQRVEEERRGAALREVRWKAVAERAREPEQKARSERPERPPVAEDERGEGDEAAAAGDVLVEEVHVSDREVRAAERGEGAGGDHRAVADPVDRDADGVGSARVLADGADSQAERRPEEDDVRQDQDDEAQPDHQFRSPKTDCEEGAAELDGPDRHVGDVPEEVERWAADCRHVGRRAPHHRRCPTNE